MTGVSDFLQLSQMIRSSQKTRISSVKCQTTNSLAVRWMTIRLYLIIRFYSLNFWPPLGSFLPNAHDFFSFDSIPPTSIPVSWAVNFYQFTT